MTKQYEYEIVSKIKEFNDAKKPIWFTKLCLELKRKPAKVMIQMHTLEDWGLIEGHYGGINKNRAGRCLEVTWMGKDFLKFCENKAQQASPIISKEVK
jgi:hypothetical protein